MSRIQDNSPIFKDLPYLTKRHSIMNKIAKLKKLLLRYSFEDLMKSFFVLNLYLPNVASPIKIQYLYIVIEEIFNKLPEQNQIKTYADFKSFSDALMFKMPSFPMMEDYVPESDWGDVKYFFQENFYSIFYGGDLSNPYDYYYAFETIHTGFDDFYSKKTGRSALKELEFCLNIQHRIITSIDKSKQDIREVKAGDFETPSEAFWYEAVAFLDNFRSEDLYPSEFLKEYTKDLNETKPVQIPEEGNFLDQAFYGTNCLYFFLKFKGRSFPVIPRKFLSVLFYKWGQIFTDLEKEIEKEVQFFETRVGLELYKFLQERSQQDEVFPMVSALHPDQKPHSITFASAFISKDRLVLFYVMPPHTSTKTTQQRLNNLVPELKKASDLLTTTPTRVGLHGQGKTVEFSSVKKDDGHLKIMIVTVIPTARLDSFNLGVHPENLPGVVISLDQLLGVIDELENVDEFVDFFEFREKIESTSKLFPGASVLDIFGAYRDSNGVLLGGADKPDRIWLVSNWGSEYRYKSLCEFWKVFPDVNIFGHPRSWSLIKKNTGGDVVLKSRQFKGYAYFRKVEMVSFFITTIVEALTLEQGKLTDSIMSSLIDSIKLYSQAIKDLPVLQKQQQIHVILLPKSAIAEHDRFEYIKHLIPTTELWKMDSMQIGFKKKGVRIVFDDDAVTNLLKDAKDRSIQVQLFIDFLKQIDDSSVGPVFKSVQEYLLNEKTKPNRFRLFSVRKNVSFPQDVSNITPELREFKIARKAVAEIALANKIQIGKRRNKKAKEAVDLLINGLVQVINTKVAEYDFGEAVPSLIENIDSLTEEHDRKTAMVENSIDQEVDYQRETLLGESKQEFLHEHKNNRYLVEKFVQIQPTGTKNLSHADIRELLAHVDLLLNLYSVSDFLHYGIYPAKIKIESDFQVVIDYGAKIQKMQTLFSEEHAKIQLGQLGNRADSVFSSLDIPTHLQDLDKAFKTDLGFGLKNLVNLLQILAGWAAFSDDATIKTSYKATIEEIRGVCTKSIKEFDPNETEAILNFLTLDPDKILFVEGQPTPSSDLPVWEYRKRTTRYSIKPLIRLKNEYCWGAHSVERASKVWTTLSSAHSLPADVPAASVKKILEKGHKNLEQTLQLKIEEIAKRFTSNVETEVHPFKLGLNSEDIGDIDVFVFLKSKNILLNIESKIIDRAFCNKDLKRIAEKIFGRTTKSGSLEEGYLQKVEKRAKFLETQGKNVAEKYWKEVEEKPKIVSIFVTQDSHWWTKFPRQKTNVHFVDIVLLESFIKNLLD